MILATKVNKFKRKHIVRLEKARVIRLWLPTFYLRSRLKIISTFSISL